MKPVALVTGAARGIGQGIALALARDFDIVAADLNFASSGTKEAVEGLGGSCALLECDISAAEAADETINRAAQCFGRLDCLVNNAGVSVVSRGDILDVTPENYDRCVDINLRGTFFLTQAAARFFLNTSGDGAHRSIITITSSNADIVSINRSEYCVAKAGLSMASQLFSVRLGAEGIGVYEIRPGFIATEMTAAVAPTYQHHFENGFVPQARWGSPEEIGRACRALAVGEFGYSTGSVFRVDGGMHVAHY